MRQANWPCPVPLCSFGDGVNRLFGIALALVTAKDGLLLIDEVENGLHHSVQYEVWKMIFALAQKLNVQVLATSHSWDTIEAFQKAASETPEDGVLVRLLRKREDIIATVFGEEDLRIVTREKDRGTVKLARRKRWHPGELLIADQCAAVRTCRGECGCHTAG